MSEVALVPGTMSYPGLLSTAPPDNKSLDVVDLIHPYWKQFDIENSIPDSWHYAVALWMTFFGIMGVLGNFLVILTFLRSRTLRTPPNFLLVNLSISDLTFCAVNGFPLLTISAINKKWVWGKFWCELYGFVGGFFGFVSISTLAWVAYDRYVVISNPLEAAQRVTKKRAIGMIAVTYFFSLIVSLPPFFGWGAYIPEGFQTSCTFDYLTQDTKNYTFNFLMYVFGFMLPVFVIFCAYVGIVRAIVRHHSEMDAQAKKMGAKNAIADLARRQEIQATKVAATSIGAYLLSWVPYATIAAFGLMKPHSEAWVTPLMSEIPVMFAKASAAWNPLIYALGHPKFRAEVNKNYPWLLACCKPEPSAIPSTLSKVTECANVSVTETVEMSRAPSAQTLSESVVPPGVVNPTV